jgi:hypothetical protein
MRSIMGMANFDTAPAPPLAYFISFRCYGTWLHGDSRGSVDRHRNVYGTSYISPSRSWNRRNVASLKHPPVSLDAARRAVVEAAVAETCAFRGWELLALNARTNHVHSVLRALCPPERVLNALKANATRSMREAGCWPHDHSPWSKGGSTRYLFNPRDLEMAIVYVLTGQGPRLPGA